MDAAVRPAAGAKPAGFADLLARTSYYVAASQQEREEIYRLRHRAYVREGAYDPNATGLIHDAIDEMPHVRVIGVRVDGELMASMRICILSAEHPEGAASGFFPDIVMPLLEQGNIIADGNRFVADPDRARNPWLAWAAVRLNFIFGMHFGAHFGIGTPRSEHCAFYRRLFDCRMWAEPRFGWGLKKPVALMGLDFPSSLAYVRRRYPLLQPVEGEVAAILQSAA
jgi:hypothetical protein